MRKGKFADAEKPKAKKIKGYKVLSPFSMRNKRYEPGTIVSDDDLNAGTGIVIKQMIEKGLIEKV